MIGLYTPSSDEHLSSYDNDIFQVVNNFDIDKIGHKLINNRDESTEVYPNLRFDPEETKWIALSSLFFGIPGAWYFYKHVGKKHPYIKPILTYSVFLIISSIISINYWLDPRYGWIRNLDLVISKITFTIACICALFFVDFSPLNSIALYSLFPMYVFCYIYSSILFEQANPQWVIFHFMFHVYLATGAIYVLGGMEDNK
jgi:hypothetical protein